MALVQTRKSDASGKEIPRGTGARIRIMFNDPEKDDMRADLTDAEVAEILPFAQPVEARPERRKARQTI
jgi:hypothetical protein